MDRRPTVGVTFPSTGIMLALAVMLITFMAVILMSVAFISSSVVNDIEVNDIAMKQPVSRVSSSSP